MKMTGYPSLGRTVKQGLLYVNCEDLLREAKHSCHLQW